MGAAPRDRRCSVRSRRSLRTRRRRSHSVGERHDYGLGASIFTNNLRYVMQAMEGSRRAIWVNDPHDNEAGPFGGMRQSGIGASWAKRGSTHSASPNTSISTIPRAQELLVPLR